MSDWRALFADLRRFYAMQPPGVQAEVEQEVAAIRQELRDLDAPITYRNLETYAMGLLALGNEMGVDPDQPSFAGHWLGNRIAAIALLDEERAG